jgi:hypothetical protein
MVKPTTALQKSGSLVTKENNMGAFEKLHHPDFIHLDDLQVVLKDNDILLAHGIHESSQPNPSPHIALS